MRYFVLICFLCSFTNLNAQVFQRKFEDAGGLALGSATVAYPGQNYGIQNEAQLGYGSKMGVLAGTIIPYSITGWQVGHVQGYMGLGKTSGFGVDFSHSSTDAYREQNIRLMYGRKMGDLFSIGGGFDIFRVGATDYGSKNSFTFGLSILAEPIKNLSIGFKLQNPVGAKINDTQLPRVIKLGAGLRISSLFMVLAETEKDLDRKALMKIGFEYKPNTRITLRTGVRNTPARVALGVGLKLKNGLGIDFGSEWHPVLGISPALTVLWSKNREEEDIKAKKHKKNRK